MNRYGRAGKKGFDPRVVVDYIEHHAEFRHDGAITRINRKRITHDQRRQLRRWRSIGPEWQKSGYRQGPCPTISPLAVEKFLARVRLGTAALKRWARAHDRTLIPRG